MHTLTHTHARARDCASYWCIELCKQGAVLLQGEVKGVVSEDKDVVLLGEHGDLVGDKGRDAFGLHLTLVLVAAATVVGLEHEHGGR